MVKTIYLSFVRAIIEYCGVIYDNCTNAESTKVEAKRSASHNALYLELGWQTLKDRRKCNKLCKMYRIVNGSVPNKYVLDIN